MQSNNRRYRHTSDPVIVVELVSDNLGKTARWIKATKCMRRSRKPPNHPLHWYLQLIREAGVLKNDEEMVRELERRDDRRKEDGLPDTVRHFRPGCSVLRLLVGYLLKCQSPFSSDYNG